MNITKHRKQKIHKKHTIHEKKTLENTKKTQKILIYTHTLKGVRGKTDSQVEHARSHRAGPFAARCTVLTSECSCYITIFCQKSVAVFWREKKSMLMRKERLEWYEFVWIDCSAGGTPRARVPVPLKSMYGSCLSIRFEEEKNVGRDLIQRRMVSIFFANLTNRTGMVTALKPNVQGKRQGRICRHSWSSEMWHRVASQMFFQSVGIHLSNYKASHLVRLRHECS
jgi:hypothetical protein